MDERDNEKIRKVIRTLIVESILDAEEVIMTASENGSASSVSGLYVNDDASYFTNVNNLALKIFECRWNILLEDISDYLQENFAQKLVDEAIGGDE